MAAWPVSPLTPLIFVAWVPLILVAQSGIKRSRFFGYTFLTTLVWNAGTTWWMWNSTDVGSIAAILFNSMLMCFPWWAYHRFQQSGKIIGYVSLISCWMGFEYIHHNWQLSWPWLTLGNVFAGNPNWVQWYEYTGVSGGTCWVLVINILLTEAVSATGKKRLMGGMTGFLGIVIPVALSYVCIPSLPSNIPRQNMVIVQPNIDPYGKFNSGSASEQIKGLIALSEQYMDSSTELVLWPETAMSVADWQDNIQQNPYYQPIFAWISRHPRLTLLSGIETFKNYGTVKETATARKADNGTFYDAFNAAVSISQNAPMVFYNKSKLVPGVESLPTFLNFLSPVFEQFGGTTGGYGRSPKSMAFHSPATSYVTAPIICYESVYGEYVGTYVQEGANVLTIMTNDGWWGNTPGHKQHLQYARLRAIETRRWVARSANTGISAVIDPSGAIRQTQPWNTATAIKFAIPITTGLTFYVQHGDYLYQLSLLCTVLLIVWQLIHFIRSKKSRQ